MINAVKLNKKHNYLSLKIITLISIIAIIGAGFISNKNDVRKTAGAENFIIDTLATGLTVPWEITFLPDKTMIFTERNGKVRLYKNGQLQPKPVLVLTDIDTTKKMGLLGVCVHPGFNQNRYLYIAHNYTKNNQALLKIVRYRLVNDSLINAVIIIDDINANQNHTGCRLKFGPDNKLYITTGDADRPVLAQDLKSLNGKILRVTDDGSVPADNPFINNDTSMKI